MKRTACLLVDCPDRKGLVAAIANFLLQHDANIVHADQHQDAALGMFFMRVEWELEGFRLPLNRFASEFEPVAKKMGLSWRLRSSEERVKAAIFVSRQTHCLADLLHRHAAGEFPCDISLIVSNHADAEPLAKFHGVAFHQLSVTAATKSEVEKRQIELLKRTGVELVILARYMQILSGDFVSHFPMRIINVHHSFLPAFIGANPYQQAFERGVKLIGATSHYVTETLDDGPIIEQDVTRISHRRGVDDLTRTGKDLEKVVLSRAVRWQLEHRILVYGRKTVVFD